jgi:hypothetical protein
VLYVVYVVFKLGGGKPVLVCVVYCISCVKVRRGKPIVVYVVYVVYVVF